MLRMGRGWAALGLGFLFIGAVAAGIAHASPLVAAQNLQVFPTPTEQDVESPGATDQAAGDDEIEGGNQTGSEEESDLYGDPPDVTGFWIDDALQAIDDWNQQSWDGIVRVDLAPPEPPPTVDGSEVYVYGQDFFKPLRGATGSQQPVLTLTLGVHVPDLNGATFDVAKQALDRLALVPSSNPPHAPDDWTVDDQTPPSDQLVPFGYEIALSLTEPPVDPPSEPDPPELVEVPDLDSLSVRDAREEVLHAGLVFRRDRSPGADRRGFVIAQDPAPGTRVEPDTVVLVRFQERSSPVETSEQVPTSVLVQVAVVLLLLALVAYLLLRPRPIPIHRIRAELRAGTRPEIVIEDTEGSPGRSLTLDSYHDEGVQTLEEV